MENASKALIIAGAILLAILLISLGIMIFNQASTTVKNNGMSEVEKTSFNQKFTKYEGSQKGSQVNSLLQEVVASNSNDENIDRQVAIAGTEAAGKTKVAISGSTITQSAKSGKTYTVTCTYEVGLVTSITIAEI